MPADLKMTLPNGKSGLIVQTNRINFQETHSNSYLMAKPQPVIGSEAKMLQVMSAPRIDTNEHEL